jgi:tripartite motif-containing protein 71
MKLLLLWLSILGVCYQTLYKEIFHNCTITADNKLLQFNTPFGVGIDSSNNVYVTDSGNNRIQKFDKDGNLLFKFGSPDSGNGEFNLPRQIAVDRNIQFLYVVDSKYHRVQVFDSNGKYIKQWGGKGNGDGKFDLPISIIMDIKGDLIVNDRGTGRVQKFDRDGNFILKFGSIGKGPDQLGIAEHMAVDKYNNIYVNNAASEAGVESQAKVMKFSLTGKFITKWGDKGEFMDPEHLAIDSEGNVYVSDRVNNNIQVFKPVIE